MSNAGRTQEPANIVQVYTGCPAMRTGSGGLKNTFITTHSHIVKITNLETTLSSECSLFRTDMFIAFVLSYDNI